jgi:hypothetical protein
LSIPIPILNRLCDGIGIAIQSLFQSQFQSLKKEQFLFQFLVELQALLPWATTISTKTIISHDNDEGKRKQGIE